jgi:hypothetical protein
MTFDAIRTMALALDNVTEATSYGTPAFKLGGAMIARLRDDIGALVVRMSIEDRQELMAEDPETYFISDHYLNYPYILVNLARVHPDAMRDLLKGACKMAAGDSNARGTRQKPRATGRKSRRP